MKNLLLFFMLFLAIKSTGQTTWKPNPKYTRQAAQDSAATQKKAFQCWGTTQKGERCKRKVLTDHTYCHQHVNQAN